MAKIGILDCTSFYASCEIAFDPSLRDRYVVVLSNNDGIIIAATKNCVRIGIKRGDPVFKIKELVEKYNVAVFSANFNLYGDVSSRVMETVASYVPECEVYSIDELFFSLAGMEDYNMRDYGLKIARAVTKGVGIPVGIGIADTKTLAKIANRFAKKYPAYKNVCIIETEEQRLKALKLTEIEDVWGVGRRYSKKLRSLGVNTAYDFTQMSREAVRRMGNVTFEKTWDELRGIPCIDLETDQPDKKSICTSRSFGQLTDDFETLSEAVATFAASCAVKLRKQKSCAVSLMVFIHTNPFREEQAQYWQNSVITLPVPTNSTIEIVRFAKNALKNIYKEGYQYKKAGVIITQIVKQSEVQANLFDTVDREKHGRLMEAMDCINTKTDRNRVFVGAQGTKKAFKMKQEKLSPNYTTDINDIIKVK